MRLDAAELIARVQRQSTQAFFLVADNQQPRPVGLNPFQRFIGMLGSSQCPEAGLFRTVENSREIRHDAEWCAFHAAGGNIMDGRIQRSGTISRDDDTFHSEKRRGAKHRSDVLGILQLIQSQPETGPVILGFICLGEQFVRVSDTGMLFHHAGCDSRTLAFSALLLARSIRGMSEHADWNSQMLCAFNDGFPRALRPFVSDANLQHIDRSMFDGRQHAVRISQFQQWSCPERSIGCYDPSDGVLLDCGLGRIRCLLSPTCICPRKCAMKTPDHDDRHPNDSSDGTPEDNDLTQQDEESLDPGNFDETLVPDESTEDVGDGATLVEQPSISESGNTDVTIQRPESSGDESNAATIGPEDVIDSGMDPPDDGATLADPANASRPADDGTDQTEIVIDAADDETPEQDDPAATVRDDDMASQPESPAGDEHTIVSDGAESADGKTSDATMVEGVTNDQEATLNDDASAAANQDGTIVESEFQSRASSGATDRDSAGTIESREPSEAGNRNETRARKGGGRPPVHETARRWQSEQRYQLVSNFARGGLGQIWLAQDARLRREVAYKELLPGALKNRSSLERFLEEAQITGQLEHPGIVPVYDIGYQQNGTPFYAMKLVRGDTLEKAIDTLHGMEKNTAEWSLAFRRLLRNFIDICNAVAFAHDRGVLHRDLKPLNVMLGAFGETMVLDWGLAKIVDVDADDDAGPITTNTDELKPDSQTIVETQESATQGSTTGDGSIAGRSQISSSFTATNRIVVTDVRTAGSQTMVGSVMGTAAYMPPEQAGGKVDSLDARSDIYSLGGILYKLLCGKQPIPKGKVREVLKAVIDGNFVPPSEHESSIEKPLEAICMKAMSKRPDDRYGSALELSADVEAWLADEPVSCFADPIAVRAKRWMKRHPRTVGATLSSAALMFAVVVGSSWMHDREMTRIRQSAMTSLNQGESAAQNNDFNEARDLINAAVGRTADEPDLEDVRQALSNKLALIELRRLRQLERRIEAGLADAQSQYVNGNLELARTTLAKLSSQLREEDGLPELAEAVSRVATAVDESISQREAVAKTQTKFHLFLKHLDAARARAGLPDSEDIDEDAKLAVESCMAALEQFDLNRLDPLAEVPRYLSEKQIWAAEYRRDTGRLPIDDLRDGTFECFLTLAEMESWLHRTSTGDEKSASSDRSLAWLNKAASLGVQSQVLPTRRAVYLAEAGRSEEAAEQERLATSIDAATALDFSLLADTHRTRARFDTALEFYLRAQQLAPDRYWVQHNIGLCYRNLGQTNAAVSAFSGSIAKRPGYAWPYILRAISYASLEQFESADADFDKAIALDADLFSIYVSRAVVLMIPQERFDDAIADLEKARELRPDSGKPLVNIAATYLLMAEAVKKSPFEAAVDDLAATAAEATKREQTIGNFYDDALDLLALAARAERSPNHPGLHQLRGQLYEAQGNTDLAMKSYHRNVELDWSNSRKAFSLMRIASIHSQLGEFDKAITALADGHRHNPDDALIVRDLGEAHLQARAPREALNRYDQFLDLVDLDIRKRLDRPELLFNGKATAHDLLREKPQAVENYTLSLLFNRAQTGVLTRRAWTYVTRGAELARADFEAAKQLPGQNADTLIGLAYTLTQLGDWQKAIQEIEAAIPQLVKEVTETAQRKGETAAARNAGHFHNAATVYAQAAALIKDDPMLTNEQRNALNDQFVQRVTALLRQAQRVAAPVPQVKQSMWAALQQDDALDPVRNEEEFRKLVGELNEGR